MTGWGAALYCGFFALAALWLFATREPDETESAEDGLVLDQTQLPERSNSAMASARQPGSNCW
jgi:hypothetical protein